MNDIFFYLFEEHSGIESSSRPLNVELLERLVANISERQEPQSVWATMLAVEYLRMKYESSAHLWRSQAERANTWLNSAMKTESASDLRLQARNTLELLECERSSLFKRRNADDDSSSDE